MSVRLWACKRGWGVAPLAVERGALWAVRSLVPFFLLVVAVVFLLLSLLLSTPFSLPLPFSFTFMPRLSEVWFHSGGQWGLHEASPSLVTLKATGVNLECLFLKEKVFENLGWVENLAQAMRIKKRCKDPKWRGSWGVMQTPNCISNQSNLPGRSVPSFSASEQLEAFLYAICLEWFSKTHCQVLTGTNLSSSTWKPGLDKGVWAFTASRL